jgi:hypothetical protein
MKIKKIFIGVFLLAFFVGTLAYFLTPKLENKIERKEIVEEVPQKTHQTIVINKIKPEIIEETVNWQEEDESKFKIKLLETGEDYHGNEINAETGEIWLGLFKVKDGYFLRNTKIKIKKVNDSIGDENWEETGKSVSVTGKEQATFLLKNAEFLSPGKVRTVFHAETDENYVSLENGFKEYYYFNGIKYTLRVEGESNTSKLILETEDSRQVLFYVSSMGDATWDLLWIGDLDGDGKLDLYANLPTFYNFAQHRLFLSSQAKNGELVKQVAMFHMTGC